MPAAPLKDHWKDLPAALQQQAQLLGLAPEDPPQPDLSSLLQELLAGVLEQLSTKKSALKAEADVVKQQYGALLTELKELQGKIEEAQKELLQHTESYNLQLEKEKKLSETEIEDGELMKEKLNAKRRKSALHSQWSLFWGVLLLRKSQGLRSSSRHFCKLLGIKAKLNLAFLL